MEIKKADSKGRVSGFDRGRYYRINKTPEGTLILIPMEQIQSPVFSAKDIELLGGAMVN